MSASLALKLKQGGMPYIKHILEYKLNYRLHVSITVQITFFSYSKN